MRNKKFYALICEKGHIINSRYILEDDKPNCCDKCGMTVLASCPRCDEPILGEKQNTRSSGRIKYKLPKFCHNCGKEYPWVNFEINRNAKFAVKNFFRGFKSNISFIFNINKD